MDYERMWVLLKQYINTKNSHGKNELKTQMEQLEFANYQKPEKELING